MFTGSMELDHSYLFNGSLSDAILHMQYCADQQHKKMIGKV